MTLTIKSGDMFADGHAVLVDANNAIGINDGGIAGVFNERFPAYGKAYRNWATDPYIRADAGDVHWYRLTEYENKGQTQVIISFATMYGPGERAKRSTLIRGFANLSALFERYTEDSMDLYFKSIGIPALGCGIGRFDFDELIKIAEFVLPDRLKARVTLYKPQ